MVVGDWWLVGVGGWRLVAYEAFFLFLKNPPVVGMLVARFLSLPSGKPIFKRETKQHVDYIFALAVGPGSRNKQTAQSQ